MKNPFYELEMPIRCELFDQNLAYAVRAMNNAFAYWRSARHESIKTNSRARAKPIERRIKAARDVGET